MPPQQLVAFGLRGFICRSCSSKLPHARRQWLSSKTKGRKGPRIPKGAFDQIKVFEQGPDGKRVEIIEDEDEHIPKDAELRISMQKKIDELEAKTGMTIDELANAEEFDQDDEYEEGGTYPYNPEVEKKFAEMDQQTDRLQAIIDRVGDVSQFDKMSPEDRERLRADVRRLLDEDLPEVELSPPPIPEEKEIEDIQRQISEARSVEKSTRQRLDVNDFPEQYHTHIGNLQRALDQFQVSDSLQTRRTRGRKVAKVTIEDRTKLLARFYALSRKGLLSEPSEVPVAVWSKLWMAFSSGNRHDPDRTAHIKRLGEDMDAAGVPMLHSQRMVYIESVFRERLPERALELWEKAENIAEAVGNDYWALGVRLLSQLGYSDRAFDAAALLFQDGKKPAQFRSLIPLIKSCLASKSENSVQRAWAVYVRMRANLGHEMNIEDYDAVISYFMEAEEPELALATFRDMMLTGDRSVSSSDSTAHQKLYSGAGNLSSLDIGKNELDWRDSRLISELPPKFKNKFFFGSWVKKLIGDGQLKAANQVLDLMQDHGIQPSPIHMNGLIGAWFRLGTSESWKMANDLAWRMIEKREELNDWRHWKFGLEAPLRPQLISEPKPGFKKRSDHFPPATLETFVLLIREYRQHQKHAHMSDLFDAYRKSRIFPNTQFMNQLLLLDLRTKHKTWAWETYYSMTNDQGLTPNIQTFTILWNMEKRATDPTRGPKATQGSSKFPTGRRLFAEMAKYKEALLKEGKIPRELYDLVILTFSLASDQVATAVALHVFDKHFDTLPDEDTARTILLQLTRHGLLNEAGIKPRRLDLGKAATQQRMNAVANVVRMFQERRVEALLEKGVVFDELSHEEKMEESVHMLSDVLRHVVSLVKSSSYSSTVDTARNVAEQMGFPDCVPWGTISPPQDV